MIRSQLPICQCSCKALSQKCCVLSLVMLSSLIQCALHHHFLWFPPPSLMISAPLFKDFRPPPWRLLPPSSVLCLPFPPPFVFYWKNPTYGRQSISRQMRIVAPIPQYGGPRIPQTPIFKKNGKNYPKRKNSKMSRNLPKLAICPLTRGL